MTSKQCRLHKTSSTVVSQPIRVLVKSILSKSKRTVDIDKDHITVARIRAMQPPMMTVIPVSDGLELV